MKWLILIFVSIMASQPIKLNAFDLLNNNPRMGELEGFVEQANQKKEANAALKYKLEREDVLNKDDSCIHCPKHLLLTEHINKMLDKMAHDPKMDLGNEVPVKINHLKFMFFTQALIDKDGNRHCRRLMDVTPDLKPTKFDSQFKLIAEDALRFSAVSTIQYMNPEMDEMVYYYRGEGAESDIVVQAILTKDGGKFRYFRAVGEDKHTNPYNLPDLAHGEKPASLLKNLFDKSDAKPAAATSEAPAALGTVENKGSNNSMDFMARIEKRNKVIPKNVHFIETNIDQEIMGGISLKGSSDTSLKGNAAKFALKDDGGKDLILIDLNTKLSGDTKHIVTVPYSVRVMEDSKIDVKGKVQVQNDAQILTMSITDQSVEMIRSEYRKNMINGTDSYVIARDMQLSPNEAISVAVGKGEDDRNYASLRHMKALKNNITMVLDVRVDHDKKASLFYQIGAKF